MLYFEFDDLKTDYTKNTQIDIGPLINYPYEHQIIDTFPYEKASKIAEGIINDIYITGLQPVMFVLAGHSAGDYAIRDIFFTRSIICCSFTHQMT